MNINDKLKVMVAEPWDFSSSDGENLFYCTVIDINRADKRELYLSKTISLFEIDGQKVDFVILQSRDYHNYKNYNIYIFKGDYDISSFCGDKDIGGKLNFVIIGSMK